MKRLPPLEANENSPLCAACGGECCKTQPGIEAPEPFLAQADPAQALAAALDSSDWVLAHHVGVPWKGGEPPPDEIRWQVILYPRPATLAERASGSSKASGAASPCVFLGTGGCLRPFGERPRMCQSLEPWANGNCRAEWGRGEAALAWRPHQGLIAEAQKRLSPHGPLAHG